MWNFGQISNSNINKLNFRKLVSHSKQGDGLSGLIFYDNNSYKIHRADYNIEKLLKKALQ